MNKSLILSWEQYYGPEEKDPTFQNKEFSSKDESLKFTSGDAYIYNCFYHDLTALDGGAIFFSSSGSRLLVEKSSFLNCSATRYTASIRIEQGNSIIAYACSQYGYAENFDGFYSVANQEENRFIDYFFDSSISYCKTSGSYTAALFCGNIQMKSVNLSENHAKSFSTILLRPNKVNENSNLGSDVKYCSFFNNTAQSNYCLGTSNAYNQSSKHKIQNSNIIENHVNNTIYSEGETTFYHCSILNNGNSCFFLQNDKSTIELISCSFDNKTTGSGTISQIINQISDSFILSLSFHETMFCANNIYHCEHTENSFLQNIFLSKRIIPSPFIFLLLSK